VLAIDRTRLANERTLLIWRRTAIMLLVSGVTLLELFEGILVMEVTGAALIPEGFLTAGLGVHRFLRTRTLIEAAEKDYGPSSPSGLLAPVHISQRAS